MHSQFNGSALHLLAISLIVVALCGFLASCLRFFFRDIAWKSAKGRNDQMGLKNSNATLGCIGILGSMLLLGVGIALISKGAPPSLESAQTIANGTKMYPDAPRKHYPDVNNEGIINGSKVPLPSKKRN